MQTREGQTTTEILKVSGVSKDFEGVKALDQVSFSVQKGHIKALIGPNGAGKTTLLNVINGFLVPNAGHVFFKDHDLVEMRPDKIALLGVSRTFQLIRLFTVNNATVLDNVMIGSHKTLNPSIAKSLFLRPRMRRQEKAVQDKAYETLRLVGLEDAALMQPGALSFGNQRLVELARSLMAEPDLLLLDEPASGLNDREVDAFMELLSVIKGRGITILLVEHNMRLVMTVSDDVVVIDFGRWLAEGPPEKISTDRKVIEAYLGAESEAGAAVGIATGATTVPGGH
jgi:ABC-type branched-subunit amino acid transport system ATPase component